MRLRTILRQAILHRDMPCIRGAMVLYGVGQVRGLARDEKRESMSPGERGEGRSRGRKAEEVSRAQVTKGLLSHARRSALPHEGKVVCRRNDRKGGITEIHYSGRKVENRLGGSRPSEDPATAGRRLGWGAGRNQGGASWFLASTNECMGQQLERAEKELSPRAQ